MNDDQPTDTSVFTSGRRKLLQAGAALLSVPLLSGLSKSALAAPETSSDNVHPGGARLGHLAADFEVNPQDVQILFVDMQHELTKASKSNAPAALAANATVLAEVARLLGLPMIYSLVPVAGNAGRLMNELQPYSNEKNTFDRILAGSFTDHSMVAALAQHRRKTLVVSGYATEVAVLQTALAARKAGYRVFIPVDAVGSPSARTESAVLRQMELAGAVPTSVMSLAAQLAPDFSKEPGRSVLATFNRLRSPIEPQ
jgi:nicotinamidase-related amidase